MALDTLQRPVVARPSSLMTQDAVPSPKQSSSQPSPPPSALRRRPLAKPKQVRIQLPPSALAAAAAYHLSATDCSTSTLLWVPPVRIHAMPKSNKHNKKNNKKKKRSTKDKKEKDTTTASLANTALKTTPCASTPSTSCIPGVVEEPPSETTSGTTSLAIPMPPSPESRACSVSPSSPPPPTTTTTTTHAPHPARLSSAWERDQRHKQQEEQRLAQYRELVMFHRIYQHRHRRTRPCGGGERQDHHKHHYPLLQSLVQAQHSSQHQQQQEQAVLPPPPATTSTTMIVTKPPPTAMVPPHWPRPRRIPPPPTNHRVPAPLPSVVWVDPPHSTDPDPVTTTTPLGADTSSPTTTLNGIPTATTTSITGVPHSTTCDTATDHGPPGNCQNVSIPSVAPRNSCSTRANSSATVPATTTTREGWGPILANYSLPPGSWTTTGALGTTTMTNNDHSWRTTTSTSSLTVPWTPSGYEITTAPTSLVYSELDGVFQLDL